MYLLKNNKFLHQAKVNSDLIILSRKLIFLNLVESLAHCESLLIIGAGNSAEPNIVEKIASNYDCTITINSAIHVFPKANWHSFELYYNQENIEQQLSWIQSDNFSKILLKPFSLYKLSNNIWEKIFIHEKKITNADNFNQRLNSIKAIKHGRLRKVPTQKDYLDLLKKQRLPIQWRGSLSLLLDISYLANIKCVGLIGTDLGGEYAKTTENYYKRNLIDTFYNQATYKKDFDPTKETIHASNVNHFELGGRPPILETLKFLYRKGYLSDIDFYHYHKNDELKDLLRK